MWCSARPRRRITQYESSGANRLKPCRVCRSVGSLSSQVQGNDSGRGCLVTVMLFGTTRGMPCAWCFIRVGDHAVLFEVLSLRDIADVVKCV
jgi:hypothetical protein